MDAAKPVAKFALLSADRIFRYSLERVWETKKASLIFVMLNPSTADADLDDPTIRRCMGFARGWGYGGIEVLNLYAFRSPNPQELAKFLRDNARKFSVLNTTNADYMAAAFRSRRRGAKIVCAWGSSIDTMQLGMAACHRAICYGLRPHCLGVNADGQPKHPLYVPATAPLLRYP